MPREDTVGGVVWLTTDRQHRITGSSPLGTVLGATIITEYTISGILRNVFAS
jgi:hypothetical protein